MSDMKSINMCQNKDKGLLESPCQCGIGAPDFVSPVVSNVTYSKVS